MTDQNYSGPRPRRAAPPRRVAKKRKVSPLTVLGVGLLTFGLVCMSWFLWQYYGTNVTSSQKIKTEKHQLKQDWEEKKTDKPATPIPGDAMALLRIPDFGRDYEQPIIVGTGEKELEKGIGWYKETSKPGDIGNFAIAGHRITHGEPFARLLELQRGAQIVVETRDSIFTYKLTNAPKEITVKDTDGLWVLDPVPRRNPRTPDAKPTVAMITITTCTDLFASPERSVAFGELIKSEKK